MNNKQMPIIKIWDSVGLGLIINCASGVLISNQTGGSACVQSLAEGIYMPICNDYNFNTGKLISPEIELIEYFVGEKHKGTGAITGIDEFDTNYITNIFSKFGLQDFISIDVEKNQQSQEAWIHVIISPNKSGGLLDNFDSKIKGILTWNNSD